MAMQRRQRQDDGMITKVVSINRVSKTVKGGRVMKFAALIVVGDGKGNIGYGVGKSGEVPEAIRKGEGAAKKNMHKVCHEGHHDSPRDRRRLRRRPRPDASRCPRYRRYRRRPGPCGPGELQASRTSVPRACAPTTPINVTAATFDGLCGLTDAESVAAKRGKTVAEILG